MIAPVRRMRKRHWAGVVAAILVLVTIFVVWPRILTHRASDRADRMIALMRSEGQDVERYASDLPPLPDPPAPAEVERQTALIADRMKTFNERLREWRDWAKSAEPLIPEPKQDEVREALDECAARFGRALGLLQQRADHLKALGP